METETVFRIILPVLLVGFMVHRGYYTRKQGQAERETVKRREEGVASKIAGLLGIVGFVAMIAYVINPGWLAWAALPLPVWLRWIGVGVALLGFALLQWAQHTMGRNWSDTPRMMKEQALVTEGPYHWVRHPIYTAFVMILGASLLISANWLIGLAWLGMAALEVISRVQFEEALLLEYFGTAYSEYMKHTGRFLPKVG
jgi:protein-S-isoprenylcysteine O-methyltransferase Ste14